MVAFLSSLLTGEPWHFMNLMDPIKFSVSFHRIPATQSHYTQEGGSDPGAQPAPHALHKGKLAKTGQVTHPR